MAGQRGRRDDGGRTLERGTMSANRPRRLIRLSEVIRRTGDSRSGIYSKIKAGKFPRQVPIGDNAVAWVEDEIDQHVADRIAERDNAWRSLGDAAARVVMKSSAR